MTSTNEYELLRAAHIILNMRMCYYTHKTERSIDEWLSHKNNTKIFVGGCEGIIQYDDVITKNNKK